MLHRYLPLLVLLIGSTALAQKPRSKVQKSQPTDPIAQRITLPNNWSLTPVGRSLPLGDLPLNMVVSPNQKWLAVFNNGQSTQSIQLFDVVGEKLLSEIVIPKSWLGIRFSPDGSKLFASGGNDNRRMIYSTANDQLAKLDSISLGKPWPERQRPDPVR